MRKRTEGSCAEIWAENSIMAWNRCVLCGSTRATVVVQLGSLFLGEAKRFPRFKLLGSPPGKCRLHSREYGFTASAPSCRVAIHLALAVLSARETVKRGSRVCCTCRATQNTTIPSHDTILSPDLRAGTS